MSSRETGGSLFYAVPDPRSARRLPLHMLDGAVHDDRKQHLDEEDHVYYYLTVLFGIETYEGYLRWCKKAKKVLAN